MNSRRATMQLATWVMAAISVILGGQLAQAGDNPSTGPDKLNFGPPYDLGKEYVLTRTLRLEGYVDQAGQEKLVIDTRQIVQAIVNREPGDSDRIHARVIRYLQRGGRTGTIDWAGPEDVPQSFSSHDNWQFRLPFQAAISPDGKLSDCRGAREMEAKRDAQYLDHPAIVDQHSRWNDWFRQLVEETTLYLPPDPVAIGQGWTTNRTLLDANTLVIWPDKSIDETMRCKLLAVERTEHGRVAAVELSGLVGAKGTGKTCLTKTGRATFHLDGPLTAEVTVTLTGTFVRTNLAVGLPPARIKATIATSLKPKPGRLAAGPATAPAGLPALDRDGREVWVYDRGASVFQDHNGKVWTILPRPANPEAAAKQEKIYLKCPVEVNDPRRLAASRPDADFKPDWFDLAGRPWQRSDGDETMLCWIEGGSLKRQKLEGHYTHGAIQFPNVPGITGLDIFADAGGKVLASGCTKLHVYDQGQWKSLDFPGSGDDPTSQQQDWLFRRIGPAVHIARDFEHGGEVRAKLALYDGGGLTSADIVLGEPITFLGCAEGKLLVGNANRLWRLDTDQAAPADPAEIARLIAKLSDASFKVREEAKRKISEIGQPAVTLLQKAIEDAKDPQQRQWLRTAIRKLPSAGTARLTPAKIGQFEMLDFLFQARGGEQLYRPWIEGQPEAEPFVLCLDGGAALPQAVRKINLPRADRLVQFDLETPDGKIVGRDSRCVFELDLKAGQFKDVFAFGKSVPGRSARVVAVKDGNYCLRLTPPGKPGPLLVWFDPAGREATMLLTGRAIAEGVSTDTNHDPDLSIVPGPDHRLWMLRRPEAGACRLAWAEGDKVHTLAPPVQAEQATLFPLDGHAVLIVPEWSAERPVQLHLGDEAIEKPRLSELISAEHQRMLNLVPEAMPYRSAGWDPQYFVRLGDNFWLREPYYNHTGSGGGLAEFSGIYHGGGWHEFELARPVCVDPAQKKLLTYDQKCENLRWMSFGEDGLLEQNVTRRDFSFGWCWYDCTGRPWCRSSMILAEAAIDQMKDKLTAPHHDLEAKAEDFPAFRMWTRDGWVNWDGTLWGGALFTDDDRGVWHVRARDVVVQHKAGHRQRLDLDDAVDPNHANLVPERPGVVWLATDQSLVRLVLRKDETGQPQWQVDRRLATRSFGYAIRGPWIIDQHHFYFASAGTLYYAALDDLLAPRPK